MQIRKLTELLLFKSLSNLRTEVSRYYLNYLWWAIEPILSMGVFYVVFGVFLNRGTEHFIAFLLTGLTAWNWFSRSVQHAATSIYQGRGLMLQVDIPKVFFPLEVIIRDFFKHFFVVVLLLLFLLIYPTPVTLTWLALPVIILVEAVLILGVGILGAALTPFIPDLSFVISTGLQLLFFGSGVFFRIENVVLAKHQYIIYLNPIAGILKAYRDVLIYGRWPAWEYLGIVFCASIVLLSFSVWLVHKNDRIYPRVVHQ